MAGKLNNEGAKARRKSFALMDLQPNPQCGVELLTVATLNPMQIIKLIVGICFLLLALYFTFAAVSCLFAGFIFFTPFYAIPAILCSLPAWLLIFRRKSRMSRAAKSVTAISMVLFLAFIGVVVIPDFVRAEYESAQNSCVNNLRQLQAAKTEWALENGKTNGTLATVSDITPYIQLDSKGNIPGCPAGGTYIIGRVGEDVRCSIGTSDWPNAHVLNETNDFDWWTNCKEAYATLLGLHHPRKS
jgi:hypothetical protein